MHDADWLTSPTARRVFVHWADDRPAWLWSGDGATLLWRNQAARGFGAKLKKTGVKLAGPAIPIKGQVGRLLRLGSKNRASLSRLQFLVGDKPVSATCSCTPIELANGQPALLIVGVDPIEPEIIAGMPADTARPLLLPQNFSVALANPDDPRDGAAAPDSGSMLAELPARADGTVVLRFFNNAPMQLAPEPAAELKVEPAVEAAVARVAAEAPADAGSEAEVEILVEPAAEPQELAVPEPAAAIPAAVADAPETVPPSAPDPTPAESGRLTSLFDRLADDNALYEPLDDGEPEPAPARESQQTPFPNPEAAAEADVLEPEPEAADDIATLIAWDEPDTVFEPEVERDTTPIVEPQPQAQAEILATDDEPTAPTSAEGVEPMPVQPLAEQEPEASALAEPTGEPPAPEADPEPPRPLFRVVARTIRPLVVGDEVPEPPVDFWPGTSTPAAEPSPPATEPPPLATQQSPPATEQSPPAANEPTAPDDLSPIAEFAGEPAGASPSEEGAKPDIEVVERVSRYNFDALSRILNNRIGNSGRSTSTPPASAATEAPGNDLPVPASGPGGALVNLGGETLVLNRLPLGILVFRDGQVLFANRAITEMIGYPSVEALREAGLAAIFPAAGPDLPDAGPVNHLVQRDGTLVPVTARLQSISWQGRPALMLSASSTEVRTGHEAAVRAFAELLAETRNQGFVEASKNGVVNAASAPAREVLGQSEGQLLGRSLSALVHRDDLPALQQFLERPARFAETMRPWVAVRGLQEGVELSLFALGQAGIVSGYFGFVRQRQTAPILLSADSSFDINLLGRISRGVRRPLNSILGFAEMIRTAAFGGAENPRFFEYVADIRAAGQEIEALVDELDDYSRLKEGRFVARPTDIDLMGLLDSCVVRVRNQAGHNRVLVRSAISERLPQVRADRATLSQAILNLLASAIDQTKPGGSVVMSAQLIEDDGIAITIRDNVAVELEAAERFVVFRDGTARDGSALAPVRSNIGLALTRALLAANNCTLSVDPTNSGGTLFGLKIPAELIVADRQLAAGAPQPPGE